MKLIRTPPGNALEIWNQKFYGSESSIDCLYSGVIFVLQLFCKTELLKFRIIHDMGQSQILIMMKEGLVNFQGFSLNTRVGDQYLCCPKPGVENLYVLNNLNTRVGDQNLCDPEPSNDKICSYTWEPFTCTF